MTTEPRSPTLLVSQLRASSARRFYGAHGNHIWSAVVPSPPLSPQNPCLLRCRGLSKAEGSTKRARDSQDQVDRLPGRANILLRSLGVIAARASRPVIGRRKVSRLRQIRPFRSRTFGGDASAFGLSRLAYTSRYGN